MYVYESGRRVLAILFERPCQHAAGELPSTRRVVSYLLVRLNVTVRDIPRRDRTQYATNADNAGVTSHEPVSMSGVSGDRRSERDLRPSSCHEAF